MDAVPCRRPPRAWHRIPHAAAWLPHRAQTLHLSVGLSVVLASPRHITSRHGSLTYRHSHSHTHTPRRAVGLPPTGSGPAAAADVCVWCVRACVPVSSPSSNPNPKPPRARFLSTPLPQQHVRCWRRKRASERASQSPPPAARINSNKYNLVSAPSFPPSCPARPCLPCRNTPNGKTPSTVPSVCPPSVESTEAEKRVPGITPLAPAHTSRATTILCAYHVHTAIERETRDGEIERKQ